MRAALNDTTPVSTPSTAACAPPSPLSRQLKSARSSADTPLLLHQRNARWAADTVLQKVQASAPTARETLDLSAFHANITASHPQLEMTPQELRDFYDFFKNAEGILAHHQRGKGPDALEDVKLCRALKWQLRAARSEQDHQRLTRQMAGALGYIDSGDMRTNHRHVGYNYPLIPSRQLSVGAHLSNDSQLGVSADQRLRDTRVNRVLLNLKSSTPQLSWSNSSVGVGLLRSREYASLKDYVSANSHSLSACASESRMNTVRRLASLVNVSNHLERNRFYANASQAFLRESLAANGMGTIALPRFDSRPAATQKTQGVVLSCGNHTAVDCFDYLAFNTDLALSLTLGKKHRELDIVDLHDHYPTVAAQQLRPGGYLDDSASRLISDIQHFLLSSSRRFTHQVCTSVLASDLNKTLRAGDRQAQALLERYVALKLNAGIDNGTDQEIRQLMQHNARLLRPKTNRFHTLSAQSRTSTATARADFSSGVKANTGKGVTVDFIHRRDDDPHLCGDYLQVTIDRFDAVKTLKKALQSVLGAIGQQRFSWDELISSLSEALLGCRHRSSSGFLVKIKDLQPVLLHTVHTTHQRSAIKLTEIASQVSDVELASVRTKQHIVEEHLGTDSLDYILPIARQLLGEHAETGAWDRYRRAHAQDIKGLLDNIAGQTHGTVLTGEVQAIRRISPLLARQVDELINQAQIASNTPAAEPHEAAVLAFEQLLLTYLHTYYSAKVSEGWRLTAK